MRILKNKNEIYKSIHTNSKGRIERFGYYYYCNSTNNLYRDFAWIYRGGGNKCVVRISNVWKKNHWTVSVYNSGPFYTRRPANNNCASLINRLVARDILTYLHTYILAYLHGDPGEPYGKTINSKILKRINIEFIQSRNNSVRITHDGRVIEQSSFLRSFTYTRVCIIFFFFPLLLLFFVLYVRIGSFFYFFFFWHHGTLPERPVAVYTKVTHGRRRIVIYTCSVSISTRWDGANAC